MSNHPFDAPIPKDVIFQTNDTAKANYVKGHYVISKLNELLGHENWSYECHGFTAVEVEQRKNKYDKLVWYISYTCYCTLTATINGNTVKRTDVGFGSGDGMAGLGKAHESAVKEAATDALKRAARTLGQTFGLALYDSTGEFIGEQEPVDPAKERQERIRVEFARLGVKAPADLAKMIKSAKEAHANAENPFEAACMWLDATLPECTTITVYNQKLRPLQEAQVKAASASAQRPDEEPDPFKDRDPFEAIQ